MANFLNYLLQVSLSVSLFLLIYLTFFKGKTFFWLNRIFLLSALIISFVIPLITLPELLFSSNAVVATFSGQFIQTEYAPFWPTHNEKSILSWTIVLQLIYLVGVCVLSLRFVLGIRNILHLKKTSVRTLMFGRNVYVQDAMPTFSFLTTIFTTKNPHPYEIAHESVHIEQKHWIDRLIVELSAIMLWFNPLMILYTRAVKHEHEFLADQGATKNGTDLDRYMQCLLEAARCNSRITLTSYFGSQTIKNRIVMLTKNKTPFYSTMLYTIIVPTAALLLVAFQDTPVATKIYMNDSGSTTIQSVPDGAPVAKDKVKNTFGFGEKFNERTNKKQHHTGIDFVTDAGVNVMATADGVVIESDYNDYKGLYVVIRHSDQFVTQYYHLLSASATKGVAIKKGEVIGLVGSTGSFSTSNHLHYEVLKDGKAVDPIEYLPSELREVVN